MEWLTDRIATVVDAAVTQLTSTTFYAQIALVAVALALAWAIAAVAARRVAVFREAPATGPLLDFRSGLHGARRLLLPLAAVILLGIAVSVSVESVGEAWLVRIAQGIAFVLLIYGIADRFIAHSTIILFLKWIGIPVALLHVIGLLDDVIAYLDGVSIELGNIHVTLYAVLRTLIFGVVLFWLGRASNATGQRVIRTQSALDAATREVVSKLFEIGIFVVIFLLLLNVMGINLTALAVFGGALGVGLGFGLQQIASNFVSGIIILLDRTIAIGDYIELEDGRAGTLRELNLRSATLETFDGKDIVVPNESFITTAIVNWTHHDKLQRYPLTFQVAYSTDLDKLFPILREVVASHPQVLSGDDVPVGQRPDAEIAGFGDSGIDILVEFWMEGIDDGDNRVGADLNLMIWQALKTHGIEIPFPQREVRLLGEGRRD